MIPLGLAIVIISFGIGKISEEYGLWIMAIGVPAGGLIILKGREKVGLKNKNFGED